MRYSLSLSQIHKAQLTDGKDENGASFSTVQDHSTLRFQSSAERTCPQSFKRRGTNMQHKWRWCSQPTPRDATAIE
jgi:hypothetical protein